MINVDSGAQCYAAISETLHRELNLPLIPIPDRMIGGPTSTTGGVMIQGVTYAVMEIQGFQQLVYFYVVPLLQHPIILGRPWEVHNQVEDRPHENIVRHGRSREGV
jgi:predicted aspartyl protease